MSELELLQIQLNQAFDRRSWHGTNLNGSIRGLAPERAAWRPRPGRHSIWELIVHTAYWKYAVTRRLADSPRGSFPYTGSNWFKRPDTGDAAALAADIRLLRDTHRALLAEVRRFDPRRLGGLPKGGKVTYRDLIVGVAAHDLYHAGQIQLLKKLQAR